MRKDGKDVTYRSCSFKWLSIAMSFGNRLNVDAFAIHAFRQISAYKSTWRTENADVDILFKCPDS